MGEGGIRDQLRAAIQRVGWSETARRAGMHRVQLHRSFGPRGNPKLGTILTVAAHVGLALTIEPKS